MGSVELVTLAIKINFHYFYIQCSLDYTEKYYLDYTENKAHSLGVRKTIRVLSGRLSKPA